MSVFATLLVVVLAPIEHRREDQPKALREWFSFWGSHPRISPDELHGRAFTAWLRAGYPLLVLAAVGTWWLEKANPGSFGPAPFFATALFALSSSVVHLTRSLSNLPNRTTWALVIAGWPGEMVLLLGAMAIGNAVF